MSERILQLATLCLGILPLWTLLRFLWLRRRRQQIRWLRELMLGAFVIFMAGMLCMALDGVWTWPHKMLQSALQRLQSGDNIYMHPGEILSIQLWGLRRGRHLAMHVPQLLGNTLLFMPWGFCLPLLWRRFRGPLRMIGMSLLLTCFIEFTQLFIQRRVEFDDLLLNFAGSMAGAGIWWCVHLLFPRLDDALLDNP